MDFGPCEQSVVGLKTKHTHDFCLSSVGQCSLPYFDVKQWLVLCKHTSSRCRTLESSEQLIDILRTNGLINSHSHTHTYSLTHITVPLLSLHYNSDTVWHLLGL